MVWLIHSRLPDSDRSKLNIIYLSYSARSIITFINLR